MESLSGVAQSAHSLISILYPLLDSPDDATVRSIVASIRTHSAKPQVLANSLYMFAKLLRAKTENGTTLTSHQVAFRKLLQLVMHAGLLKHVSIFEAFDADALATYIEPSVDHAVEQKRLRTRQWFTQTRFNLFREESEGYSKVIALLWLTISPDPPLPVNFIIKRLVALIGHFSLDSNRVIELVLSAASEVVGEIISKSHAVPSDTRLPPIFSRLLDEFATDHVYNVVGAMFQTYHAAQPTNSPTDTPEPPAPECDKRAFRSFLGLVVVLIRESRMTIANIWHHLSPRDNSVIFDHFSTYERELIDVTRTICTPSAPRLPTRADDSDKLPRPGQGPSDRDVWIQYPFVAKGPTCAQYQKLELIAQLIGMCRWRDAMSAIRHLSVNGEHVDVAAVPHIAGPISALVEFLITPVANSLFPTLYPEHTRITDAIQNLGGHVNGYPSLVRTVDEFLDPHADSPGTYAREMLNILGPYARSSISLLKTLCRLLKGRDGPEAIALMRDVVFPASALLQSNVGLADAIWSVLKTWSHTVRWNIYGYLQYEVSHTCAVYNVIAVRASYETRYILKRLTSDSQRLHKHSIAKITHGQALAAFAAALDRIQGYPADVVTITPLVESCMNCTEVALDMLVFLVLDRMADSSRSRLKSDGINVAQWYSTMSLFLGICLRKLPLRSEHMEGVVSFLYVKLAMEPEALLITALSDIIKSVADIDVDFNMTAKQIAAQGGGPLLQKVVAGVWGRLQPDASLIGTSFDSHSDRERRLATLNLQGAFAKDGVHTWIAISIAQLTRSAVFEDDLKAMPLKLSANIVDRARSSLMQLSQFLDAVPPSGNLISDKKIGNDLWQPLKAIGFHALVTDMNVPTSSAAILMSPTLDFLSSTWEDGAHLNSNGTEGGSNGGASKVSPETTAVAGNASGPTPVEPVGPPKSIGDNKAAGTVKLEPIAIAKVSKAGTEKENAVYEKGAEPTKTLAKSEVPIVQTDFSTITSTKSLQLITPTMTYVFWTLKLSDIAMPTELYESERKRIHSVKGVWEKEYERYRRHAHGDVDHVRRCEHELRLTREFAEQLDQEHTATTKRQKAIHDKIRDLRTGLSSPAANGTAQERRDGANVFLQECVLPRCRVSIPDALFCAKFVLILLNLDIPAIPYKDYFEGLIKLIPIMLRSCSENEALAMSRLLMEVLYSLEKWRSNKMIFEAEISIATLGGLQYLNESGKSSHFRHEEYCQWIFEIHRRLTEGICNAVVHREYIYSRNCLSVLAGVAEVFPKVLEHSAQVESCVAELAESELADIRLSSNSVLARLRSGKVKRVPEHIFRLRPFTATTSTSAGRKANERNPRRKAAKSTALPAKNATSKHGKVNIENDEKVARGSTHKSTTFLKTPDAPAAVGKPNTKSGNGDSRAEPVPNTDRRGDEVKANIKQESCISEAVGPPTTTGKRGRDGDAERTLQKGAGNPIESLPVKRARLGDSESPINGGSSIAEDCDRAPAANRSSDINAAARDSANDGGNRRSDSRHRGARDTTKRLDSATMSAPMKGGGMNGKGNLPQDAAKGNDDRGGDGPGVKGDGAKHQPSGIPSTTEASKGNAGGAASDGVGGGALRRPGPDGGGGTNKRGDSLAGGRDNGKGEGGRGLPPPKIPSGSKPTPRSREGGGRMGGERGPMGRKRSFNELDGERDGAGLRSGGDDLDRAGKRDGGSGGNSGERGRDANGRSLGMNRRGPEVSGHSGLDGHGNKRRRDNNTARSGAAHERGRAEGGGHHGHDNNNSRYMGGAGSPRGRDGTAYPYMPSYTGQTNEIGWMGRADGGNERRRDDAEDVGWQVRPRDDGHNAVGGGLLSSSGLNDRSRDRRDERRDHRDQREALDREDRDRDGREQQRERDRGSRDRVERRRHNGGGAGGRRRRNGGH